MYTIAIDVFLSIVFIIFLFNVRKLLVNIRRTVWRMSEQVDQIQVDQCRDLTLTSIKVTKRMRRAVKRGETPTFRLLKDAYGQYILVQE